MSIDHNVPCQVCGCQCMTIEQCHKQQNRLSVADQPVECAKVPQPVARAIAHAVLKYRVAYDGAQDEAVKDIAAAIKPYLRAPERESGTLTEEEKRGLLDAVENALYEAGLPDSMLSPGEAALSIIMERFEIRRRGSDD